MASSSRIEQEVALRSALLDGGRIVGPNDFWDVVPFLEHHRPSIVACLHSIDGARSSAKCLDGYSERAVLGW
jgi:hypothetical protein